LPDARILLSQNQFSSGGRRPAPRSLRHARASSSREISNGIFQCSSQLVVRSFNPRKSSLQRGTGAISARADMATAGHMTGYGQLALTGLAEGLEAKSTAGAYISAAELRRNVAATRRNTVNPATRNASGGSIDSVARFGVDLPAIQGQHWTPHQGDLCRDRAKEERWPRKSPSHGRPTGF